MDGTGIIGRSPPVNLEAEMALLGSILVRPAAFDRVVDFLKPEHFAEPVHGRIFEAMATLIDRGSKPDPVALKNVFERDGALRDVGGAAYLARLAGGAGSFANAESYGRTIFDLWKRRKIIEVTREVGDRAHEFSLTESADDITRDAEELLYGITATEGLGGGAVSSSEAVSAALTQMDEAFHRAGGIPGAPSGIQKLDQLVGGFEPQKLYVLGGRPSSGKSLLADTCAQAIAWAAMDAATTGKPPARVLMFSLEMSVAQLAMRRLSAGTGINHDDIRFGRVHGEPMNAIVDFGARLAAMPMSIDDTAGLTISDLRTRARRQSRQPGGLAAVVVDYLQLIEPPAELLGQGETAQITYISKALKRLAKELNVPVIALSQLSRDLEKRDDKRPMLSDLRSSGSIEQDADVVMFVYREFYYLSRTEPQKRSGESPLAFDARHSEWAMARDRAEFLAEIIVAKQRAGRIGTVTTHFDGAHMVFGNVPEWDQKLVLPL